MWCVYDSVETPKWKIFKHIDIRLIFKNIFPFNLSRFCPHMLYISFHEWHFNVSLRKHAYSNILKILPPKNENFQIKKS